MDLFERYEEEVKAFLEGEDYWPYDKEKGHTWISRHTTSNVEIGVLTVEPPEGGQYEIAIRFPLVDGRHSNHNEDKYSGYIARDGYIWGKNTHGH